MSEKTNNPRAMYSRANVGTFPEKITVGDLHLEKVMDLRYGLNPHQTAAYYRIPGVGNAVLGRMELLKSGKSGLSEINLQDISVAVNILKYFQEPAVAVMKHSNASGVAVGRSGEPLANTYREARDCDPRAAFGAVVVFNVPVDSDTAVEIMSTFIEGVVAPNYTPEALEIFNSGEKYGRNKEIRVVKVTGISDLPKYVGDDVAHCRQLRVLADGSLVVSDPFLTVLRGPNDVKPAFYSSPKKGEITANRVPDDREMRDLLIAWYICANTRSNGVVIVKNGRTLAVGTGEQDRVGAVEKAIDKYQAKYQGSESIEGAVMASDGFFPDIDAVQVATEAGVRAIIQPGGSIKDYEVIEYSNQNGLAMVFSFERCFAHH